MLAQADPAVRQKSFVVRLKWAAAFELRVRLAVGPADRAAYFKCRNDSLHVSAADGVEVGRDGGRQGERVVADEGDARRNRARANLPRRVIRANLNLALASLLGHDGDRKEHALAVHGERERALGYVAVGARDEGEPVEGRVMGRKPLCNGFETGTDVGHAGCLPKERIDHGRALSQT